jgi:hypothetical protein
LVSHPVDRRPADALMSGRREADIARMQRRYGLTRDEAICAETCLREPGVLDDWNDDRSILGMRRNPEPADIFRSELQVRLFVDSTSTAQAN